MPRATLLRLRATLAALTALSFAGCADAPTGADATAETTALLQVPTGTPEGCPEGTTGASGTLPGSGALYLICVPAGFDPATGSLVVYAPGSVPPQLPLTIRDDQIGGTAVSELITGLGFAFATTSYRNNGLVIVEGTRDLQRLVSLFRQLYGPIGGETYAVGVSEGAQVVTLATERQPQLFDGTLAACGPIGDFQRQLNYYGDIRLAFEAFFAPVLAPILAQLGIESLGTPTVIPEEVVQAFGTPAAPGPLGSAIAQVILANPALTNQFLAAVGVPLQLTPANEQAVVETILRLLAYSFLFGNDAREVLGGSPYDNVAPTSYPRPIEGLVVPSYAADQPALSHLAAKYETSGRLRAPLVTLFNTGDPIIPAWHEEVYRQKVLEAGAEEFLIAQIAVPRVGHCDFTVPEVLGAFETLVQAVTGAGTLAM